MPRKRATNPPPDIRAAQIAAGSYASSRRAITPHICAVCGREFRGIAKAIHCSPACKTRAYRARIKTRSTEESP